MIELTTKPYTRVSARANEARDGVELTFHEINGGTTTLAFDKRHSHDIITALNEALSDL